MPLYNYNIFDFIVMPNKNFISHTNIFKYIFLNLMKLIKMGSEITHILSVAPFTHVNERLTFCFFAKFINIDEIIDLNYDFVFKILRDKLCQHAVIVRKRPGFLSLL
jgi:hypothetical protein